MKRLGSIIQAANRETKPKTQATNTDDTQIPRPDLRFANKKQQRSKQGKGPEPKQNTHTRTTRFGFDTGGGPTVSSKTCTLKLYCYCRRPSKRCENQCNCRPRSGKLVYSIGDLYTTAATLRGGDAWRILQSFRAHSISAPEYVQH